MATSVLAIFVDLYPNVMVSSTSPAFNLTAHNTASPPYTLGVMTIIAVIALPFVLAYQAWSYYVFRRRITADSFRPQAQPAAAGAGPDGAAFAATSSVTALAGAEQGQAGSPATTAPPAGTAPSGQPAGAARGGRPGRGTRRRPRRRGLRHWGLWHRD
jgi:Cytochrome bd terminal oxidase subunit II